MMSALSSNVLKGSHVNVNQSFDIIRVLINLFCLAKPAWIHTSMPKHFVPITLKHNHNRISHH